MRIRRLKGNRPARRVGQSIIEYLVIAAVVIAAIIAIRGQVATNMQNLMTNSAQRVGTGADRVGQMTFTAF